MATGYLVMAKRLDGLDLEIPLNIMAKLTGLNYANEFGGRVFIKGFLAMLVAAELSQDILLWYYYLNVTRERIVYFDHYMPKAEDIGLLWLNTTRHVVGWCLKCDSYAGKLPCSPR